MNSFLVIVGLNFNIDIALNPKNITLVTKLSEIIFYWSTHLRTILLNPQTARQSFSPNRDVNTNNNRRRWMVIGILQLKSTNGQLLIFSVGFIGWAKLMWCFCVYVCSLVIVFIGAVPPTMIVLGLTGNQFRTCILWSVRWAGQTHIYVPVRTTNIRTD